MSPSKSRFQRLHQRLAAFNVASLFTRKRPPGQPRTVYVSHPSLPPEYLDHRGRPKAEHVYTPNQVITSKYNLITFIPRNLIEQFRRVANIFFLGIAIIQFFSVFSTIAPGVAILPLVFIVAVTGLKDGYEDFKRHQSDSRVNQSTVWVLEGGGWKNPNSMKPKSRTFIRGLMPGSFSSAKGKKGQKAPAYQHNIIEFDDKLSHATDLYDDKGARPHWRKTLWEDVRVGDFVKLVEGESLPGDVIICSTSEEEDVAFVETKNLDGETNLKSRHAVPTLTHLRTATDCANAKPFQINCDRPETDLYRLNANVEYDGQKTPVDISMTLLRGTLLKNTSWVIGVVLFTGLDTKIVLNSGNTPSKRSRVERQMNPQVFLNLALLALMALVCAIVDAVLEQHYYPLRAPWLYDDNQSDNNPQINGLITFFYAILTFQDIVPISLYISIEFVRTMQAAFIYLDPDIWCKKTDQPTIARSWNLSDDLGQIDYIFSDKTGTLTQNSMVFRQCSIGGKAYRGNDYEEALGREIDKTVKQVSLPAGETKDVEVLGKGSENSSRTTSGIVTTTPVSGGSEDDAVHFQDAELQRDLEAALTVEETSEFAAHARSLNGFFTVLSLCHTVLTAVDPKTGDIIYKAQSPDEAALVQAAADVGFVFLGRDRDILRLRTPFSPEEEKYELLNILDFSSARKRMSVILRKVTDDSRIFLLSKGADNVIFDRLKAGGDELKTMTDQHLREFANEGLRTLTLAYKVVKDEDYAAWNEHYKAANAELDDREAKVEAVCDEMERDLRLLGATAIEDRLQDGVPEAIADLKRAGIKIWVATGDKLETAIAIGRSTNLVTPDSNIIIVRGSKKRAAQEQMLLALQQYFPECSTEENKGSAAVPNMTERSAAHDIPLQRINTGVSSIVGDGNGEREGGFVLVVDGAALLEAFATEENKDILLRLAMKCEGVICCRVSPLQKALIVKLVKDGLGVMTLAIGDGANDVSMIQAADVGVGISGEEGLQAVNSSDYAIAQFRFLKRLLLVHGHWSYARNGTMILNFFYKNIMAVGVLWWFQIYNGWSGSFAFNYIYILFWNSLWTILPVIGIGLFDRIIDADILMELPELYRYGRERYWFSIRYFCIYIFDGIVQTAIIFFLILYTYKSSPTARRDGWDIFTDEFSTPMVFSAVLAADIFAGITATAWTIWLFLCIMFGVVILWCFTAIYSIIPPSYASTTLYGIDDFIFRSAYFWLVLPVTLILALTPRIIAKTLKISFRPDDIDIIRAIRKQNPYFDLSNTRAGLDRLRRTATPSRRSFSRSSRSSRSSLDVSRGPQDIRLASRTDMATGLVSVDRGFDFVTEENGVAMRRMQSRLSEQQRSPRLSSSSSKKGRGTLSQVFSLKRGLRRKSVSVVRKSSQ
ncbi:hypothetical protein AX17_005431 [Amanita inopinata Kibby_2008]|nr:hypothetical protein AX17_005431 [Amanita inopinata Kibby_2008]